MKVTIWAEFVIAVAHSNPKFGRPELHGHSYRVRVFAPEGGSVEQLQALCQSVKDELDHRNLNNLMAEPTMENIGRAVLGAIPRAHRVLVDRPLEGVGCEVVR